MELNHLYYFYEVARLGSFTQASRTLRVSQPSISKIIKVLEDREGVKLLDRSSRRVTMTEVGERFYRKCEIIFGQIAELKSELSEGTKIPKGKVAFGLSDNLSNYVLPELLKAFTVKYPLISFEIYSGTSADIKKEILAGHLEFGLFHTEPKESHFRSHKIGSAEFVVIGAYGSKRFKKGVDLSQAPHVGCRVYEFTQSYPVLKMLRAIGVEPKIQIVANSQETQLRLAAQDLGYAVVPKFMAKSWIKSKAVQVIPVSKPIGSNIYFAMKTKGKLSPSSEIFMRFVESRIQEILSSDGLQ